MINLKNFSIGLVAFATLAGCGGSGVSAVSDAPQSVDIFFRFRTASGQPNQLKMITLGNLGVTTLDLGGGTVEAPSLSRDGNWILGNMNGYFGRMPASGGAGTQYTAYSVSNVQGAPNAASIVFEDDGDVFVANWNGGLPTKVVPNADNPHFHPLDQTRIIYSKLENNQYDIWTAYADGTQPQNLTNTPDKNEVNAVYSWNGSKIYFQEGDKLWTMNPDGNGRLMVYGSVDADNTVAVPGGRILFARANNDGSVDIMTVKEDGTDPLVHFSATATQRVSPFGARVSP